MLHVIIQKPFDETAKCVDFEIGDSTKEVNPELVQSVLATDDELAFILRKFDGIPKRIYRDEDVTTDQSWFGDDAKFIVANWL